MSLRSCLGVAVPPGNQRPGAFKVGLGFGLAALLASTTFAGDAGHAPVDAATAAATALSLPASADHTLAAGQSDVYVLDLESDQFLGVDIEPHGVSLSATLSDPSGVRVAAAQDPGGGDTPLRLSAVARESGHYRLVVVAAAPGPSGRYHLTAAAPRTASDRDRRWVEADAEVAEAARLGVEGTAESRREALRHYERARALWEELGEPGEQAYALNESAVIQFQLGAFEDARAAEQRALPLWQRAGNVRGESEALSNLASTVMRLGDLTAARQYYEQVLPKFHQLGLTREEAVVLNNIGTVHKDQGDAREALADYARSLPLRRQAGDLRGEATTLMNMGVAYRMLGERTRALDAYQDALPLARAAKDNDVESAVLQNLAALYVGIGDTTQARPILGLALELSTRSGDRVGEAFAQGILGVASRLDGDLAAARMHLERALELRRDLRDRYWEANTLTHLGAVDRLRHEDARAEESLRAALEIQRAVGDRFGVTYTLLETGALHEQAGRPAAAKEALGEALASGRSTGDPAAEATCLYRLAQLQRAEGQVGEARAGVEAALSLLESLRSRVAGPSSRASFFVNAQEVYDLEIELLMGSPPAAAGVSLAFDTSERKRARSLLDVLSPAREGVLADLDPDLRAREAGLHDHLAVQIQEQARLAAGRGRGGDVAAMTRTVEDLAGQYADVQARLEAERPAYAALDVSRTATVAGVQQLLDDQTVLIEFSLGQRKSYAWAVTADAIDAVELPARDVIAAAARAYGGGLSTPPGDRQAASRSEGVAAAGLALSRMLLAPLARHLGRERVVIVPDGALQYVPFAALPWPAETARGAPVTLAAPLIAAHEVVLLPSASVLGALRAEAAHRPRAPTLLAVVADPVLEPDDPRLARARSHLAGEAKGAPLPPFSRLPFSRVEADAITALVAPAASRRAVGFEASRERVLGPALVDARIVHFATHATVDDEYPERSALILSRFDPEGRARDGFLRLPDVYGLRLAAELVVLSGCRTALGKDVRGEGLVGLVRGFMYAGAPRVVAALWSVDDRATAVLMKEFYRKALIAGRPWAAALREAQLAIRSHAQWRDPYYWAGFELQGDWR